jgi:hypothetical protein
MELFVVMMEYRNQGFPLAYLFLENTGSKGYKKIAVQRLLKEVSKIARPTTFLTDKDSAQIAAIESEFPSAKVQLCCFHVIQAIERACKKGFKWSKMNVGKYSPYRLDVSVLSGDTEREFPSLMNKVDEYILKDVRKNLLEMIRIHFNRHPMIPSDVSRTFWTASEIHQACAREAYRFCRSQKLDLTWIYLI